MTVGLQKIKQERKNYLCSMKYTLKVNSKYKNNQTIEHSSILINCYSSNGAIFYENKTFY